MIADHENRAARRARERAGRFQRIRPHLGGEGRFVDQIDNGLPVMRHFQHRHLPGRSKSIHLHAPRVVSVAAVLSHCRLRIAYGNIGGIEVSNVTSERRMAIFEGAVSLVACFLNRMTRL
ncbi:hypothetical protein [Mesorhizobium sp. STM 4661]|uniref:hypothetical protein n=1 Tax=Mesorhizobium sp. STM 4661 TaxID=1297570 RepID=UPI001FCC223D|nr:hypothetical protein [Mesorhizobium sp. STM 4661]